MRGLAAIVACLALGPARAHAAEDSPFSRLGIPGDPGFYEREVQKFMDRCAREACKPIEAARITRYLRNQAEKVERVELNAAQEAAKPAWLERVNSALHRLETWSPAEPERQESRPAAPPAAAGAAPEPPARPAMPEPAELAKERSRIGVAARRVDDPRAAAAPSSAGERPSPAAAFDPGAAAGSLGLAQGDAGALLGSLRAPEELDAFPSPAGRGAAAAPYGPGAAAGALDPARPESPRALALAAEIYPEVFRAVDPGLDAARSAASGFPVMRDGSLASSDILAKLQAAVYAQPKAFAADAGYRNPAAQQRYLEVRGLLESGAPAAGPTKDLRLSADRRDVEWDKTKSLASGDANKNAGRGTRAGKPVGSEDMKRIWDAIDADAKAIAEKRGAARPAIGLSRKFGSVSALASRLGLGNFAAGGPEAAPGGEAVYAAGSASGGGPGSPSGLRDALAFSPPPAARRPGAPPLPAGRAARLARRARELSPGARLCGLGGAGLLAGVLLLGALPERRKPARARLDLDALIPGAEHV